MVYEEIGDFTTTDWTIFGIGVGLIVIGAFLSGNEKMKTVLMIWDRRNFVGFSLMMGLGLLGACFQSARRRQPDHSWRELA